MFEPFLYSNVFVHYKHYFTSSQKRPLFEHFKPLNDPFSIINLYIFKETCIVLESPFHSELNGFCFNSIY